jgi:hypothetical protein
MLYLVQVVHKTGEETFTALVTQAVSSEQTCYEVKKFFAARYQGLTVNIVPMCSINVRRKRHKI